MDEIKYKITWKPLVGITVYELAQCIPYIFSKLHDIKEWDALDENIKKHFIVTEYEYGKMIREAHKKLDEQWEILGKLFDGKE